MIQKFKDFVNEEGSLINDRIEAVNRINDYNRSEKNDNDLFSMILDILNIYVYSTSKLISEIPIKSKNEYKQFFLDNMKSNNIISTEDKDMRKLETFISKTQFKYSY